MKSHTLQILILMAICNVAALVGYFFLFDYIKNQTESSTSLLETINLSEQKNSRLNSLRNIVQDTKMEREKVENILLNTEDEIFLIEKIEKIADESGLSSKTVNVASNPGSVDVTNNFHLQMETSGSWNNTMYFLNQLENMPFDAHVRDLSFNKKQVKGSKESAGWTGVFNIDITEKK